jgi:hypothetical protein
MNMMIDIAKVADLVGSDKLFWILKAGDKPSPKIDIYCAHLFFYRLLVNQEQRNTGTRNTGTASFRNTEHRNTKNS